MYDVQFVVVEKEKGKETQTPLQFLVYKVLLISVPSFFLMCIHVLMLVEK